MKFGRAKRAIVPDPRPRLKRTRTQKRGSGSMRRRKPASSNNGNRNGQELVQSKVKQAGEACLRRGGSLVPRIGTSIVSSREERKTVCEETAAGGKSQKGMCTQHECKQKKSVAGEATDRENARRQVSGTKQCSAWKTRASVAERKHLRERSAGLAKKHKRVSVRQVRRCAIPVDAPEYISRAFHCRSLAQS